MSSFILAAGLFLLAFSIHVVIWRVRPPRATGQALILVLTSGVIGGAMAVWLCGLIWPRFGTLLPVTASDWLQAIIAALAVACVYVMNYPAVEVESPTLVMIELFARAGRNGLSRDELYLALGNDFLVAPRVEDLLREGLAIEADGKCRLTQKGAKLEHVFGVWRRLLGAGLGG